MNGSQVAAVALGCLGAFWAMLHVSPRHVSAYQQVIRHPSDHAAMIIVPTLVVTLRQRRWGDAFLLGLAAVPYLA